MTVSNFDEMSELCNYIHNKTTSKCELRALAISNLNKQT